MDFKKIVAGLLIFTLVYVSSSLAGSDFKEIDTAQLHSMIVDNAYRLEGGREKQFTVIDAREKEAYDNAHIFSAISIPEKDFDIFKHRLPGKKDLLLVVYSNAKGETGRQWAHRAALEGYTNIAIYSEGFSVWQKKRMPVAPLSQRR
ncbi:MAG: rhodanese-like domain-containing protein [Nitrospirae bacterium]|nr:rhodanese-like domain-containing protein [Nitrospirota bacterium]